MSGKRCDFTGRSVISPDLSIEVGQVGIPMFLAKTITKSETVTAYNIERLRKYVKNGPRVYPGANFIIRKDHNGNMTRYNLNANNIIADISTGDVIERHLIDGDIVIMNRQPTLHAQSMMAHNAVINRDENVNTLRLNPAVAPAYAGDFDGDEMNIHVPQSERAAEEVKLLMSVRDNMFDSANGSTSFGSIQDSLLGAYLLTTTSMKFSWRLVCDFLSNTSVARYKLRDLEKREYTGHEIVSLIIPPGLLYESGELTIHDGKITKGYINAKAIGAKKKDTLLHAIAYLYDTERAERFLNDIQRLVTEFNLYNGFTIDFNDVTISKDLENDITNLVNQKIEQYDIDMTRNEDILGVGVSGMGPLMQTSLSDIRSEVTKFLLSKLDKNNNFIRMMNSGSKGDDAKLTQILGMAGLQLVDNSLILKHSSPLEIEHFRI